MTKDETPPPRPNAGGSYVLDPKGKLTRKTHTAPAPDRAELRRRAKAAKPEKSGPETGGDAAGKKDN